ncbi:MAG: methyltransferase domain-containing protein [Candidatus Eremiobacteraeota bacterium]|nr:methyltransferase domain-containing protein [Candidatus Eremiobacteraeota bacterium]
MEHASGLRETMVAHLERSGVLRHPTIAAAMRGVPRHHFLPDVPIEDAYADRAIAIKVEHGEILSSISQPGMIGLMLDLLAPHLGDRILEIGTGSGYHAALLAELAGPHGSITTTDLDGELAARARATLAELGYRNIRVLVADGGREIAHETPFDRVVVTARSDDIAAAWWHALAANARLVVPLRLEAAGEYAIGFVRRDHCLQSVGLHPCAFLALRGDAASSGTTDIFYRDPGQRKWMAHVRRVSEVVAVQRERATPALLDEADIVIARPVTLFGVRFS